MVGMYRSTCGPGANSSGDRDMSSMRPIEDSLCQSVNTATPEELEEYRSIALRAAGKGHVGVLLLAGGQGTRLGVPYPKGMYKIGLPSGETLYQIQVERVLRLQKLASLRSSSEEAPPKIVMYVMTSEHTMG